MVCCFWLQIPNEVYRPPMEVYRGSCRQIKKGYQRTNSPRYYISIPEGDEDGKQSEIEEPRVVVQMDTESPAIYQKSCLDHYFDNPIQVSTIKHNITFYHNILFGTPFIYMLVSFKNIYVLVYSLLSAYILIRH